MEWTTEALPREGQRLTVHEGATPLRWREVAAGLRHDKQLRESLTGALARFPHPQLYWETAPSSRDDGSRPFEMVLLPARNLAAGGASPLQFAEHLRAAGSSVCSFGNLGGDARLVVPQPGGEASSHGHLAAFVRGAPTGQIHALWQTLGEEIEAWWAEREAPLWVSTAGDAVPWLHLRLDSRPKYYKHGPYRAAP